MHQVQIEALENFAFYLANMFSKRLLFALHKLSYSPEVDEYAHPIASYENPTGDDYNFVFSFRSLTSEKSKQTPSKNADILLVPQSSLNNQNTSNSQYMTVSQNKSQMVSENTRVLENLQTISRVNFQKVRRMTTKLIAKMDNLTRSHIGEPDLSNEDISREFLTFAENESDIRIRRNENLWHQCNPKYRPISEISFWSESGIVKLSSDYQNQLRKQTHENVQTIIRGSIDRGARGMFIPQAELLLEDHGISEQDAGSGDQYSQRNIFALKTFGPTEFEDMKRKTSSFDNPIMISERILVATSDDHKSDSEKESSEYSIEKNELNMILNSSGINRKNSKDMSPNQTENEIENNFLTPRQSLPKQKKEQVLWISADPYKPRSLKGVRFEPDYLSFYTISNKQSQGSIASKSISDEDYSEKNRKLQEEEDDLWVSQAIRKITAFRTQEPKLDESMNSRDKIIEKYQEEEELSERYDHPLITIGKQRSLSVESVDIGTNEDGRNFASSQKVVSEKQRSQHFEFDSSFRKIENRPGRTTTFGKTSDINARTSIPKIEGRQSKLAAIIARKQSSLLNKNPKLATKNFINDLMGQYFNLQSLDSLMASLKTSKQDNKSVSQPDEASMMKQDDSFIKIETEPKLGVMKRTMSSVGVQKFDSINGPGPQVIKTSKSRGSFVEQVQKVKSDVNSILNKSFEENETDPKRNSIDLKQLFDKVHGFDNYSSFKTWLFYRHIKQKIFINKTYPKHPAKRCAFYLYIFFQNKALQNFFYLKASTKAGLKMRLIDNMNRFDSSIVKFKKQRLISAFHKIHRYGQELDKMHKLFQKNGFKLLKMNIVIAVKILFLVKRNRWQTKIFKGLNKLKSLFILRSKFDVFAGFYSIYSHVLIKHFSGKDVPKNFTVTIVRQQPVAVERQLNFSVFNECVSSLGNNLSEINLSKMLQGFEKNMQVYLQNITVRNSKIVEKSEVIQQKSFLQGQPDGYSTDTSDLLRNRSQIYVSVIANGDDEISKRMGESPHAGELFVSQFEPSERQRNVSVELTRQFRKEESSNRISIGSRNSNLKERSGIIGSETKTKPKNIKNSTDSPQIPLKQGPKLSFVRQRSDVQQNVEKQLLASITGGMFRKNSFGFKSDDVGNLLVESDKLLTDGKLASFKSSKSNSSNAIIPQAGSLKQSQTKEQSQKSMKSQKSDLPFQPNNVALFKILQSQRSSLKPPDEDRKKVMNRLFAIASKLNQKSFLSSVLTLMKTRKRKLNLANIRALLIAWHTKKMTIHKSDFIIRFIRLLKSLSKLNTAIKKSFKVQIKLSFQTFKKLPSGSQNGKKPNNQLNLVKKEGTLKPKPRASEPRPSVLEKLKVNSIKKPESKTTSLQETKISSGFPLNRTTPITNPKTDNRLSNTAKK